MIVIGEFPRSALEMMSISFRCSSCNLGIVSLDVLHSVYTVNTMYTAAYTVYNVPLNTLYTARSLILLLLSAKVTLHLRSVNSLEKHTNLDTT